MGAPNSYIKRITDIIIAAFLAILTFPILLFSIILIKIESRGSAFFLQERAGMKGKSFKIFKLRTMVNGAEKKGPLLTQENDPRITKLGRFLRRFSIDEFPQFYNILLGQMSIIGPRPEVMPIVKTYTNHQKQILNYKPGLTGYVQVNGRAEPSVEEKIDMDLNYYKTESFLSDFYILIKTIKIVINNDGNVM